MSDHGSIVTSLHIFITSKVPSFDFGLFAFYCFEVLSECITSHIRTPTCVMLNKCETWAVTSDSPEQPQPRSMILVGGSFKYSNILYVARPALH